MAHATRLTITPLVNTRKLIAGSACWPAAGGSSAWPLPVPIRFLHGGVSWWLDPGENLPGLRSFCSSHLAAPARWESPPKLGDGTDPDSDGRQQCGDRR